MKRNVSGDLSDKLIGFAKLYGLIGIKNVSRKEISTYLHLPL